MSDRLLEDWLDSYLVYTEESEPPALYKVWVGVGIIASVLQRKCFTSWEKRIYPNMYIVLVGRSGMRKGTAMDPGLQFLQKTTNVRLAAEAITREALIGELKKSFEQTVEPDTSVIHMHSSLTVFSPELAVFLGYDNKQLLSDLTDWYDCRDKWEYRTKTQGTYSIQGVWLNLIGATTPALIQNVLPRDAIGGGLTGRIVFVFGDKKSKVVPFPVRTQDDEERFTVLAADLGVINAMCGEFSMQPSFRDVYTEWYHEHNVDPPFAAKPDFHGYVERRPTHLRKLSMIMNASRGGDMVLTDLDFTRARKLLEATEQMMPFTYKSYVRKEPGEVVDDVLALLRAEGSVLYKELLNEFESVMTDDMQLIVTTLTERGLVKMRAVKNDMVVEFIPLPVKKDV